MKSIIQIHIEGKWHNAALIESSGVDRCSFEYLNEYIFSGLDQPVSFSLPVSFQSQRPQGICPSFLLDFVPQGIGRKFLIENLKLKDADNLVMPLIQKGAFNPVGRLRLDTAVEYAEFMHEDSALLKSGFSHEAILKKDSDFIDVVSRYGMLGAGTTGLQGAAAKFMLAKSKDGLWFVDSAIPEDQVESYWIVKLPRGKSDIDRDILENEAAYMRVAKHFGVRTHEATVFENDMLFIPRFDRVVKSNGVVRLHQESLASIAGHQTFGVRANHFDLVRALSKVVTNPTIEIVEYIKRDILNLLMKNTDNHARNTAIQQLEDGTVQLTPLFDFAPMFLDPEGIARSGRWVDRHNKIVDDARNFEPVIRALDLNKADEEFVLCEISAFSMQVKDYPDVMKSCGVGTHIIDLCHKRIFYPCVSKDYAANNLAKYAGHHGQKA